MFRQTYRRQSCLLSNLSNLLNRSRSLLLLLLSCQLELLVAEWCRSSWSVRLEFRPWFHTDRHPEPFDLQAVQLAMRQESPASGLDSVVTYYAPPPPIVTATCTDDRNVREHATHPPSDHIPNRATRHCFAPCLCLSELQTSACVITPCWTTFFTPVFKSQFERVAKSPHPINGSFADRVPFTQDVYSTYLARFWE